MNRENERPSSTWSPTTTPPSPAESQHESSSTSPAELLATLERVEGVVRELRDQVDTIAREKSHREFSFARLTGSLLQALVAGFLIAALADWVYEAEPAHTLVKLAFAGVLQIGALSAFLLSLLRRP